MKFTFLTCCGDACGDFGSGGRDGAFDGGAGRVGGALCSSKSVGESHANPARGGISTSAKSN